LTKPPVERVLSLGVRIALIGGVLLGVGHLLNVFVFDGDVWTLDAESEVNVWAWASSVATFAAAFVALVLALLARAADAGRLWFLAFVLAFFSVDDILAIHERVGRAVRDDALDLESGWGRIVWPTIFFPLLASAFLILWRLGREAPPSAGRVLRLGLGLLAAAVALEIVSSPWYISGRDSNTVPGALEVAFEEGCELAGWILVAAALTAVMLVRAGQVMGSDTR
jgi:hypothetical protein